MENVKLSRSRGGPLFYFAVPRLAGKQTAIMRGDRIRVCMNGEGKWFEGMVTSVVETQVGLRFHDAFTPTTFVSCSPLFLLTLTEAPSLPSLPHSTYRSLLSSRSGATFDVQFTLSSIPARRQMQALSRPLPRCELLFPSENDRYPGRVPLHVSRTHPAFFNSSINAAQRSRHGSLLQNQRSLPLHHLRTSRYGQDGDACRDLPSAPRLQSRFHPPSHRSL